jgi:hypothetical protein
MAEDVMEDIRLLQIVELIGRADEGAGRKTPIRQMLEEHRVGHEARNGDHAPAGESQQPVRHALEVRDAGPAQVERLEPAEECVAGPLRKNLRLPVVKRQPDGVVFGRVAVPPLRDGPVRGGAWRWRCDRFRTHDPNNVPGRLSGSSVATQ